MLRNAGRSQSPNQNNAHRRRAKTSLRQRSTDNGTHIRRKPKRRASDNVLHEMDHATNPTSVLLRARIRARALELGFARCHFTALRPVPEPDVRRFDSWIDAEMHGEMRWLENHRQLRVDPSRLEDGMKTAVVLLAPYECEPFDLRRDELAPISRYALGDDYHGVLRDRMRTLAEFISNDVGRNIECRPAVDSAPVLERSLAREAGVGWIGKSTMLLTRDLGTYHFIAELLVDIDISEETSPVEEHCGTCTSCIDICPTGALSEPGHLDARRCISYLTIELRDAIPHELRPMIGEHLYGCDECQEVCPWNKFAQAPLVGAFRPRDALRNIDATDVLNLTQQEFSTLFRRSAIKRTKRRGLARNAAVVLGNRKDPSTVPALAQALLTHDEPLVRGHAAWAMHQFDTKEASEALAQARTTEADPQVLAELDRS